MASTGPTKRLREYAQAHCPMEDVAVRIPSFFDFGAQPVSEKQSTKIQIINVGNYPLNFSWGAQVEPFSVTPLRGSVPIAGTVACDLFFQPMLVGASVAMLTLNCAGVGDKSWKTKQYHLKVAGAGNVPYEQVQQLLSKMIIMRKDIDSSDINLTTFKGHTVDIVQQMRREIVSIREDLKKAVDQVTSLSRYLGQFGDIRTPENPGPRKKASRAVAAHKDIKMNQKIVKNIPKEKKIAALGAGVHCGRRIIDITQSSDEEEKRTPPKRRKNTDAKKRGGIEA